MLSILLLLGSAFAGCPDLAVATEAATDALVSAHLDDAHAALTQAEASFSCGLAPDARALARYWLAEAAVASVEGRADDARDAWQAAARLAPEQWDTRYGPQLRAGRDAAVAAATLGKGSVRLDAMPERATVWVDGAERPNPAPASEGLHLVQVGAREVEFGRVVLLGPDENMTVKVELAPDEPEPRGLKIGLMAGGGVALAGGAGLLWVAHAQSAPMDAAVTAWRAGSLTTEDARAELDARWSAQRAAGVAGYGLMALGAAGVVVGGVW